MTYDEINTDENIFNRDTISNWEKQYESQLKELKGDELDKLKSELEIKKMYIFDELIRFEDNGKFGIKSRGFNKIIVPAEYEQIKGSWENVFPVKKNGKYGLIRVGFFNYEIIYPMICDDITFTPNYLWRIEVNRKFGLLENDEQSFKIISEPVFDSIESCQHDSCNILTRNGKKGIYHNGVLINPEYDEIELPHFFGWIKFKNNNVWGYIGLNKEYTTNVDEAFFYYPFMLMEDSYESLKSYKRQ